MPSRPHLLPRTIAAVTATLGWGSAVAAQTTPAASPPNAAVASICADRPTKSSNACAVDLGHWQVEADIGNGTFQRLDGVTTDVWLVGNPTVKYGVAPTLDVEANLALYQSVRTHDAAGTLTRQGIGDLYLRLKWAGYTSKDGAVQAGLYPYLKLPTARRGVGNGETEAGVVAPVNIKLNDQWSIGFAPEADALLNATGSGRHLNMVQTVNASWSLPKDYTLYAELWGDWSFDPSGTVRQYSLDFAVSRLFGKDVQIDAGVNLGLNRVTPGVNLYAGVARRF